ncbi:hypothetical protein [Rhodothalassium salexigens]|uniref:hypothetical protein n=1 Tax=Rhodothalassium salexigens TaxID=1086 RepID=UPI001912C47F|nr:hypothetical protein [Rhodothalassium salexigens]
MSARDGFSFGIGLVSAAFALILAPSALSELGLWAPDRDDTDPPDGRSQMGLRVDYRTGCQYLVTPFGGITPRLDASGHHICEAPEDGPEDGPEGGEGGAGTKAGAQE